MRVICAPCDCGGGRGGREGKGQGGIHGKRMFLESETSETSKPAASYEKQTRIIFLIWRLKQDTLRGGGGRHICW